MFTAQAVISKGHVYASGSIGVTKEMKLVEGGVQPQTVRPDPSLQGC